MRYLGLDIGEKTIGVAVGEQIASELATVRAESGESFYQAEGQGRAIKQLEKIFESEQADAMVIGLPVDEQGRLTSEAAKIKQFGSALSRATDFMVHYTDETLTSFMAQEMLEGQGLSVEAAKRRVDQLSAQLILQQYLEEHAGP